MKQRFSEYAPHQWSLAPTAFATKFMGEALRLLAHGPPIDSAIFAQAIAADRRAIVAVLTRPDLYEHGRKFSNQSTTSGAARSPTCRSIPIEKSTA